MTSTDPTKKLIHDLSIDVLGRLSKVVVKDTIFQDKRNDETKPLKKKDVVAGVVHEIEKVGVRRLSDSLKITDSQAICETLKIDFKDSSKNNKNVLSKRLRVRVATDGLEEVLGELESDQQTACLEALQMKDKSGTSKGIAARIAGEVRKVGAEVVLSKMDMAFLKELAETQGLDVYDLNSQSNIIEAILTGKIPAKRPRFEAKKEPISKKKPKLEAGITVTDMMQHYNLTELQDFARDNGLMVSGKKKEVMKRLAAHFAGEEEPAAKKAKTTPKKETTKKETTKKEPAKKTKKEEKKEEEEEEAKEEKEEEPKKTKKGKKEEKKEEKEEEEKEEAPKSASKSPKKGGKAKKGGKKEDKEVGER